MEASSSSFRPPTYVNQWVNQGISSLEAVGKIEINQSPTIFRVPKHITQTMPEAYTPHLLGLGPYNHFRHEFHVTDRLKRAILKDFIEANSRNFSGDFLDMMKKLEVAVRASYGEYLDLTQSTLAYIMAVDSYYLLYYLRMRSTTEELEAAADESDKFGLISKEFSKDVLLLDNQIPAVALAQMGKEVGVFSNTNDTKLYSIFYDFCRLHSPLKLSKQPNNKSTHLLAHMYNLIVCNRGVKGTIFYDAESEEEEPVHMMVFVDYVQPLFTAALQSLTPIVQQTFQLTPVGRLVNLFTKVVNLANFISKKQTQTGFHIPSVSTLSEKLKLDFKLTRGGIRDIKLFQDGEEIKKKQKTSTLCLPEITLEYGSEVILRNLVAYEAAIGTPESKLELTHYVDLMCSIIDTPKDVHLLRHKRIISGSLCDEEVAEMFNGISSCVGGKSTEKSESLIAVEEVNKMVETWENQKLWRRVYRFCHIRYIVTALTLAACSVMVVQQVLEMVNKYYCQLYGCTQKVDQMASHGIITSLASTVEMATKVLVEILYG